MPAAYTYEFIRKSLPEGARRILEVGCGDGELAALLQKDGFSVVALDSDEEAVAAAKSRGIDVRAADWPDFTGGLFDAVLFTRSLHHMHDLEESVEAAFAALNPSGRLIVEDFDAAYSDEPTLAWLGGVAKVLAATGLPLHSGSFLSELLDSEERPLKIWRNSQHGQLHSARDIEAGLRSAGSVLNADPAAYFFRYITDALPPGMEDAVRAFRRHEIEMIELGKIEPLGRRFTAEVWPARNGPASG